MRQRQILTAAAKVAARRPERRHLPLLVLAERLCPVDFSDCMAVNRVQGIGGFFQYAFPVASVLCLTVYRVARDAVAMHHRHLIPARPHACVERQDNAVFDGTHDLIRVRHIVDCYVL